MIAETTDKIGHFVRRRIAPFFCWVTAPRVSNDLSVKTSELGVNGSSNKSVLHERR
jgi:hypothetical protein